MTTSLSLRLGVFAGDLPAFSCGSAALDPSWWELPLLLWLRLRRAAFYALDKVASVAAAALHGGGGAWLREKRKTLYLGAAI